jgi:hypothetical protein
VPRAAIAPSGHRRIVWMHSRNPAIRSDRGLLIKRRPDMTGSNPRLLIGVMAFTRVAASIAHRHGTGG